MTKHWCIICGGDWINEKLKGKGVFCKGCGKGFDEEPTPREAALLRRIEGYKDMILELEVEANSRD